MSFSPGTHFKLTPTSGQWAELCTHAEATTTSPLLTIDKRPVAKLAKLAGPFSLSSLGLVDRSACSTSGKLLMYVSGSTIALWPTQSRGSGWSRRRHVSSGRRHLVESTLWLRNGGAARAISHVEGGVAGRELLVESCESQVAIGGLDAAKRDLTTASGQSAERGTGRRAPTAAQWSASVGGQLRWFRAPDLRKSRGRSLSVCSLWSHFALLGPEVFCFGLCLSRVLLLLLRKMATKRASEHGQHNHTRHTSCIRFAWNKCSPSLCIIPPPCSGSPHCAPKTVGFHSAPTRLDSNQLDSARPRQLPVDAPNEQANERASQPESWPQRGRPLQRDNERWETGGFEFCACPARVIVGNKARLG